MTSALGTAYGAYFGTSTTVANALCLIMDPATPEAGSLQVSVAVVGAPGESVGLTMDGAAWSPITTLSSALSTGGAITALPVAALATGITAGALVLTASGTSQQLWVVSSTVSGGATSIPVNSQTPNFAYPSGSGIGSTLVLDTVGQALYTAALPALTTGTHVLGGIGSNSGTYDIAFPIKFNAFSTAPDTNSPTPPTTTQQTKWRFFDPRVSVYTPGQVPRMNLANRPRCTAYGVGQDWALVNTYPHGTYSLLTGQTTPLTGVSTALRKTASYQATTTSGNLYGLTSASLMGATSTLLSTGGAITSIPVSALPVGYASGATITLTSGAHTQTWTLSSAASVGATTLAVTSQTPNFAYPIGTQVSGPITAIPVSALPVAFASGSALTLTSGANTQNVTSSSTATIGATSIAVTSFTPNFAYPSTTIVGGPITAIPVVATTQTLASGAKVGLVGLSTQIFTLSGTASSGATSLPVTSTTPTAFYSSGASVVTADATSFDVQLTNTNPDVGTTTAANSPVVTPGATYTISFYVRVTTAASLTGSLTYAFYDIAGNIIGTAATLAGTALTSGSWVRQSFTVTAPKNAAMFGAYLNTGAPAVLDTIDVTGILIEHGTTLGTYFDGTSTATDTVYYWAGLPGVSVSVAAPGYYQMLNNPEKWTSPNPKKSISHTSTPPVGGQILAWEAGKPATTFEFSGVTTTQAEYQNLQAWAAKGTRFWLVDHRNIPRLVMFTQLDIVPRNSPVNIWASNYTMHVTQYEAPGDGFS